MNRPSPSIAGAKKISLPRLALRFPHLTLVLSLVMVGLGVYSFLTIPQRMVPKIPTPNIGVVTKFPGMSAEDMERYITRPLEKRLQIAGGVQYVLGVSQAGYSKIVVYFRYDVDLEKKQQEIKNLLDVVANELPRSPTMTSDNTKVGLRNGKEAQILEGLEEPAYVVVAGNRSLTNGETVMVIAREGGF